MLETNHSIRGATQIDRLVHFFVYHHIRRFVTAAEAVSPYCFSRLPSKGHSVSNEIPQSHRLQLSVNPFGETYSSFSTVLIFSYGVILILQLYFVKKKFSGYLEFRLDEAI